MIMNPMMIMAVNKNQKEPFLGVRQSREPCESLPSLSHLFGNDDDDDAVKDDVDDHNMFLCYNLFSLMMINYVHSARYIQLSCVDTTAVI